MAKKKKAKNIRPDEVYPNSPLVEVVCELRFPSELEIECRRSDFHKKIKKDYPVLMIPGALPGKAMPLEPYRFENGNSSAGIMLSIDKCAFYVRTYEGHQKFIQEFLKIIKVLRETYLLQKINRLGWRYINVIPFTRENGMVPLKRFVSVGLEVPEGVSKEFENISMVFISRVGKGSITTKIEPVIHQDLQQEALLLDFDFSVTEGLSFSKLSSHIKSAHEYTRDLFEDLITDDYREYLRGEEI